MDTRTFQAIHGLVQRHHVHFDVREEVDVDGDERRRLGWRVRLWAVVSGARILPGDASASLFADALREVANQVIPDHAATTRVSIAPTEAALYDSRVVPGADEIALDILIVQATDPGSAAAGGEERCMKAICRTLESVGAQQQD